MKELRRVLVVTFLVGPLIGLYTTLVIENLWNWFAAESLHLPEISFWVMYGLVLLIGLFAQRFSDPNKEQEYSFKAITTALDACVPEDKKEWVNEQLEDQRKELWFDIGLIAFLRVLSVTWVLVLGWAVHSFLV